MDNLNHKGWIVGQGIIVDMGNMSEEEVTALHNMSADARKLFIEEYLAKYPDAFKQTAGFCKERQIHVNERECNKCAQGKGWTQLVQWNACRGEKLSRI